MVKHSTALPKHSYTWFRFLIPVPSLFTKRLVYLPQHHRTLFSVLKASKDLQCATTMIDPPYHDQAPPQRCSTTPPKCRLCQPHSQSLEHRRLLGSQRAQDDSKSHTLHPSCNNHRNRTGPRLATTIYADPASLGLSIPSNRRAPDILSSLAAVVGRGAWCST